MVSFVVFFFLSWNGRETDGLELYRTGGLQAECGGLLQKGWELGVGEFGAASAVGPTGTGAFLVTIVASRESRS